jgi:hypothetical protein
MTPVDLFKLYVGLVRRYWETDKQRYLTEAMHVRIQLLKTEAFTSDFLDGLSDGIRYGLFSPANSAS